jgi:chlorobactene glucosyltransferase
LEFAAEWWWVAWLAPWLLFFRLFPKRPRLADVPPQREGPLVSVIIPARNEAAVIQSCVASVLATGYSPVEVLVVDDRSTDDTAARASELARLDPRLRVVDGEELPGDWYGKPWACMQGARLAQGDVLLFTDADTRHQPMLLPHAVAALSATGAGIVTVSPHLSCVTFWERVVMPQVWLLLGTRYHPSVVNRATRPRDTIANGQFILTSRESYLRAGTHEAVKGEVAEDLALAQRYTAGGGRVWFAFAEELLETRMYTGLAHLVEGWSKNLYLGGRRSFPEEPVLRALVPVALSTAMLFWLVPPLALLASLVVPALLAPALVAVGLSVAFWAAVSMSMRIPPWYGLAFPAGAAVALWIALRSAWRGNRRVEWKGRVYESG